HDALPISTKPLVACDSACKFGSTAIVALPSLAVSTRTVSRPPSRLKVLPTSAIGVELFTEYVAVGVPGLLTWMLYVASVALSVTCALSTDGLESLTVRCWYTVVNALCAGLVFSGVGTPVMSDSCDDACSKLNVSAYKWPRAEAWAGPNSWPSCCSMSDSLPVWMTPLTERCGAKARGRLVLMNGALFRNTNWLNRSDGPRTNGCCA